MKSATTFFTDDPIRFATNYAHKASFSDRLNLFEASVQRSAPAPAKVLDFGCGPGVIASAVCRLGYDVLGTDGAAGMVRQANAAASAAGLDHLRFELMDAASARFAPQSFDVIICSSVLEYLPHEMVVLRHLVESLKLGGTLLVSVPNAWSLIGIAERLLRCLRRLCRLTAGSHLDYSLRHYSAPRFADRLVALGLDVQRRTSFEFSCLGQAGVRLSRHHALGAMMLFEARRVRVV